MTKSQKEFFFYYESLTIEPSALCIVLGLQRSTLGKWLDGSVTNIPAIALSAMKMAWFMKELNPDLFCRWLLIQEYGLTGDDVLDDDNISLLMSISKKPRSSIIKLINKIKVV